MVVLCYNVVSFFVGFELLMLIKCVLIVEDDVYIVDLLCMYLGDEGYEVVYVVSGDVGLCLFE